MYLRIGACLVLILLIIAPALGFGISPARKAHAYQPLINGEITIVNSQRESLDLYLVPRGDLAEYVTISPSTIVMTPTDPERSARYTVQIPQGTLDPGQHRIDIVALTFQGTSTGTVSAAAGVSSQVIVEVPYSGAFIETRLDYTRTNRRVVFPLFNKGTAPTQVDITLSIVGPTNEVIDSIRRTGISVDAQSFTEETIELPDLNAGSYLLRARVQHDSRIIPLERVVEVGVPRLTVFDFELSLSGNIVKIALPVESQWNQKIREAYAIHDISTTAGTFIERIKTPTIPIEAFGTTEFTAFWEAPGEGEYTISTLIHYDGETQTHEQMIAVTPTGAVLIGQTARATTTASTGWLIFGVLMLVIINIVLITLVLRRKR